MKLNARSFAVFVYPFSFDRGRFADLVGAADRDALAVGDQGWPVWARDCFPHDDLLGHVADYLNPPLGVSATACLWRMDDRVLTSPKGMGLRPGATRLYLRGRVAKNQGVEEPGRVADRASSCIDRKSTGRRRW